MISALVLVVLDGSVFVWSFGQMSSSIKNGTFSLRKSSYIGVLLPGISAFGALDVMTSRENDLYLC